MALEQKEIWEKLAGVLEREKERNAELMSGIENIDLKLKNLRLKFNEGLDALSANFNAYVGTQSPANESDEDIVDLKEFIRKMNASASARDKVVERDLAEIREWLKGDGTWPSRNNGKG